MSCADKTGIEISSDHEYVFSRETTSKLMLYPSTNNQENRSVDVNELSQLRGYF